MTTLLSRTCRPSFPTLLTCVKHQVLCCTYFRIKIQDVGLVRGGGNVSGYKTRSRGALRHKFCQFSGSFILLMT